MAEYLSKPVMLDVTGQEIRDKLDKLDNITASIDKLVAGYNGAIKGVKQVRADGVVIDTVDQSTLVSMFSAPTTDEYNTFKNATNDTLDKQAEHIVKVEATAESANSLATTHQDMLIGQTFQWNFIQKSTLPILASHSVASENWKVVDGTVYLDDFIKSTIDLPAMFKDVDLSANTTIAPIKADVTSLQEELANLETGTIHDLEQNVNLHTSQIALNADNIADIQKQLDDPTTGIESKLAAKADKFDIDESLKYTYSSAGKTLGVNATDGGGLDVASTGVSVEGFKVLTTAPTDVNTDAAIKVVILDKADTTPRLPGYMYIYLED